jgi:hypothetical protein
MLITYRHYHRVLPISPQFFRLWNPLVVLKSRGNNLNIPLSIFLIVEMYLLIRVTASAVDLSLNLPEIYILTFIIRISRSARILSVEQSDSQ